MAEITTITTTRTDLSRTGISTQVVENIEEESLGNKVISRAVIPFVRPRTISVTGECFRPGIRLYAFFDGRDMSTFVTPKEQQYSNVTSPVEGSPLITNGAGKVEFDFRIPEYRFQGQETQPRFKSGELEFRLTSSSTNLKTPLPLSAGQTTYISSGILETLQETIIATRNARVVQETVNETTSITRREVSSFSLVVTHLHKHFLSPKQGGCFLTKLDLYFARSKITLYLFGLKSEM